MSDKRCDKCDHWVNIPTTDEPDGDGFEGTCRAGPPKILFAVNREYSRSLDDDDTEELPVPEWISERGRWPRTRRDDQACGEFKPRDEPQEPEPVVIEGIVHQVLTDQGLILVQVGLEAPKPGCRIEMRIVKGPEN